MTRAAMLIVSIVPFRCYFIHQDYGVSSRCQVRTLLSDKSLPTLSALVNNHTGPLMICYLLSGSPAQDSHSLHFIDADKSVQLKPADAMSDWWPSDKFQASPMKNTEIILRQLQNQHTGV
ncbi:uncharacterized protein LOC144248190 [Lonchura striata]